MLLRDQVDGLSPYAGGMAALPTHVRDRLEGFVWGHYPGRVRSLIGGKVGGPVAPGWLTDDVADRLTALDVPVRKFAAAELIAAPPQADVEAAERILRQALDEYLKDKRS